MMIIVIQLVIKLVIMIVVIMIVVIRIIRIMIIMIIMIVRVIMRGAHRGERSRLPAPLSGRGDARSARQTVHRERVALLHHQCQQKSAPPQKNGLQDLKHRLGGRVTSAWKSTQRDSLPAEGGVSPLSRRARPSAEFVFAFPRLLRASGTRQEDVPQEDFWGPEDSPGEASWGPEDRPAASWDPRVAQAQAQAQAQAGWHASRESPVAWSQPGPSGPGKGGRGKGWAGAGASHGAPLGPVEEEEAAGPPRQEEPLSEMQKMMRELEGLNQTLSQRATHLDDAEREGDSGSARENSGLGAPTASAASDAGVASAAFDSAASAAFDAALADVEPSPSDFSELRPRPQWAGGRGTVSANLRNSPQWFQMNCAEQLSKRPVFRTWARVPGGTGARGPGAGRRGPGKRASHRGLGPEAVVDAARQPAEVARGRVGSRC